MHAAVAGLEPAAFWRHFAELSRTPRPSQGEGPAIEHVCAWASRLGLEVREDPAHNLVIRVPATAGRDAAPTVILQGHLDMVCERRPDSPNDPAEGRIELVRDGGWVRADGTTLGADDGVAIAAMMALAEDAEFPHGPLELLMTVAEEVGLDGANRLDGSLVSGRILLNLDTGEDGRLTVGCAGSTDSWIRIAAPREPVEGVTLAVSVSGVLGGHSGGNIAEGRANAIKVLGRVLRETYAAVPFRLSSLHGGKSRNAIPRDASAVCVIPAGSEAAFRSAVEVAAADVRELHAETDPGVTVSVEPAATAADAWTGRGTETLLDALAAVPTGPLAMSADFDGLVETSTSLGEALTEDGRLTLHSLSRSASDAALPEVIATLEAVARLAGGTFEVEHNYGGWRPDLDSPVLAVASRTYERLFGAGPHVTGVHGGLETAVIAGKVGGLDMISFGPQIEGAHSPDERLEIASVGRFWQLLAGILDELSSS